MSWRGQRPRTEAQQVAKLDDLRLPFGADTAYAYSPRETGNGGGAVHILLLEPFEQKRLSRAQGDTLCGREFWGLDRGAQGGEITCRRCLEVARRITARAAEASTTYGCQQCGRTVAVSVGPSPCCGAAIRPN